MKRSKKPLAESKKYISPVLALLDPNLEKIVSAETSLFGLGVILGGIHFKIHDSHKKQRYAQIQKEALAFTSVCKLTALTTFLDSRAHVAQVVVIPSPLPELFWQMHGGHATNGITACTGYVVVVDYYSRSMETARRLSGESAPARSNQQDQWHIVGAFKRQPVQAHHK